jgi:hypothetical protein
MAGFPGARVGVNGAFHPTTSWVAAVHHKGKQYLAADAAPGGTVCVGGVVSDG